MTDTKLLYEVIDKSGLKIKYLCDKCNLTYQGFQNKAENLTEFKPSEIQTLTNELGLSNKQKDKIFFAQ